MLTDSVRGAVVSSVHGDVQVMTRENMEVMLTDMGLDASCVSEGSCEVETARNLGVDYVVSGRVAQMGTVLVVSVKLHETATGRLVSAEQVRANRAVDLLDALKSPTKGLVATLAGPSSAATTAAVAPPPRPDPRPVPSPATTAPKTAGGLLAQAYELMKAEQQPEARRVLEQAQAQHPQAAQADEIAYRLAETYFNEQNHPTAISKFNSVINQYPRSKWTCWSFYRIGESFEALGKRDGARAFYKGATVKACRNSEAAALAKGKL